jgi:hypothetical protein
MIEHRAAGVANTHRLYQRGRPPAREPVGEQGSALGGLLGHRREPCQHVHRRAADHARQALLQFLKDDGHACHPSG